MHSDFHILIKHTEKRRREVKEVLEIKSACSRQNRFLLVLSCGKASAFPSVLGIATSITAHHAPLAFFIGATCLLHKAVNEEILTTLIFLQVRDGFLRLVSRPPGHHYLALYLLVVCFHLLRSHKVEVIMMHLIPST